MFVERQTQALARQPDVEVRVIAPIGLPPWPLSRHPRYRALATLPRAEEWHGLPVERPPFRVWPGASGTGMPAAIERALLPRLRALRATFAFDVIAAEFFYPDAAAAMRLARVLGVPFSAKARGADIHYWSQQPGARAQIEAAGNAAAGMLAVSGAMRNDMADVGLPVERIKVHHTGVDLAAFCPADRSAAKATLGVVGPLALSIGALIPRKRHELAIAAAAQVPGLTLLIAGEGESRAILERQIDELGVSDRVRLLGSVPHANLPKLLQAADLFILASRSEGLANAWVEAVATGVPVIAADVGGARELIDRPAAGRIIEPDVASMVAAMSAILADSPPPEDVRESALRFTWDANGAALGDHLRAIVAAD